MKSTAVWNRVVACCNKEKERAVALLCGAHARLGRRSPLRAIPLYALQHITDWMSDKVDDRFFTREGACSKQEIDDDPYWVSWLPSKKAARMVCAFGNFNRNVNEAGSAYHSLMCAYVLLLSYGAWVPLDKFTLAVERGNVMNLECYAFYRSGAYAHLPEERLAAIRLVETLFGVVPMDQENKFKNCFCGDGVVEMSDGTTKLAQNIKCGDVVCTARGNNRVVKIEKRQVNDVRPMVRLNGLYFTTGHPVFLGGSWVHPFEVAPVEKVYVSHLFNFELEGGPFSTDHEVKLNGLLTCTLGKDCGERIASGWPAADAIAGRGYWKLSGTSAWATKVVGHNPTRQHNRLVNYTCSQRFFDK
eukprot:TRINITY_DN2966_c0_g1_i1.p1 TRINITY_DN2966_c0_g1~~TRINITY_DN2966_c0_g1_i1.p1  ORF type:complete len:359 (-),score=42.10 TRINITY_DN2966_c0_g1_i1:19-1095(-)